MKKEIRDLVTIRADPVGYCPTPTLYHAQLLG